MIFLAIFLAFKLFLDLFSTFCKFFWRLLASLKKKNAKKPLKILRINLHRQRFLEGERKSCATSFLMYLRGPLMRLAGLQLDWSEWSKFTSGDIIPYHVRLARGMISGSWKLCQFNYYTRKRGKTILKSFCACVTDWTSCYVISVFVMPYKRYIITIQSRVECTQARL